MKFPPVNRLTKRFFAILGPGLITGAADDDPSGIASYSIAGAQLGTSLLWMAWVTWPMMTAVQMMCARIGMVSGVGLSGAFSAKFPRAVIIIFAFLLLIANSINIGADLSGMADAANLLTGINTPLLVVFFGMIIAFGIVRFRYEQLCGVLKWLTVSVFAYIITAFIVHPNWALVAKATFHFSLPRGKAMAETVVAILGTTISPYLFYWQAGQEIEETRARSRRLGSAEVSERLISDRRIDVAVGTLLSNVVMFFVILVAALTLHAQGIVNITTSRQAAEALRPLAGNSAMLLYTIGIVPLGLLAIPTLAGSSAYALAETFGWADGLDDVFKQARPFYGIILFSMLVGVGLNFMHIAPLSALFWTAIINGVLAPFLIFGILMVARDTVIMKGRTSSRSSQIVVFATGICMLAAAAAMFFV